MNRRTVKRVQLVTLGLNSGALFFFHLMNYTYIRFDQNNFALGDGPMDLVLSRAILAIGLAGAILLALRKWLPLAVAAIYVAWMFVLTKNPMIRNVSSEWLVWTTVAVLFDGQDRPLGVPTRVFERGLWLMFGINYLYSGLSRIESAYWRGGTAVDLLLHSPIAYATPLNAALLGSGLGIALTYFTLAAETLFLPLSFLRWGRPFAWLTMSAVHLGLASTFRLWPISLTMLLLHVRLFDPGWLNRAFWSRRFSDAQESDA